LCSGLLRKLPNSSDFVSIRYLKEIK